MDKILFLNEEDMIRAGVKDMIACIDCMKDTFVLLNSGDYRMGGSNANNHGIKVTFPKKSLIKDMPLDAPDRRFASMPAYLGGRFHSFGIKSYGSNPNNKSKGLPRSILTMSLLDVETGIPLSYMSANILSGMRTGAVVGLGVEYLANKNSNILAVIGPGNISKYVTEATLIKCPDINRINVYGIDEDDSLEYIDFINKKFKNIECKNMSSLQQTCRDADIVLFTNSNANDFNSNPHISDDDIKEGALIICTSALICDFYSLKKSNYRVITDNYKMYEDWGKEEEKPTQRNVVSLLGMGIYDAVETGVLKRKQVVDLGDIICNKEKGRQNSEQKIILAIGGMPIEDVAWAYECYQYAIEHNIGTKLSF